MKKLIAITLIFLCCASSLFGQHVITIEAFVLEENTNKPLPYVNIGFLGKGIGTVSDENGKFLLQYDEDSVGDFEVLQFSSLGYETLGIQSLDLFSKLSTTNKIYLKQRNVPLDEVIVTFQPSEEREVGHLDYDGHTLGYWKEDIALGGEIATKIKINKKNSRLLDLKFRILENISDSLKLRVNIYNIENRLPGKNLLNSNIFHIVKKDKGIDTINLRPYNIKVDNDVIVSIELVEVFGDKVGFAVSGKGYGTTYTRYISQDSWKRIKDAAISFKLSTSYPPKKTEQEKREPPQNIALLWDHSASMFYNRNNTKEMEFLKAYLNDIQNVSVSVIKFRNQITDRKTFKITNGDSGSLLAYLKNTHYDGATNLSDGIWNQLDEGDITFLFSDGISTISNFDRELSNPVFCIASSKEVNHDLLQDFSFITDGHYINLTSTSLDNGLKLIQFNIDDNQVYGLQDDSSNTDMVYGKVFNKSKPLEGVSIKVKGSFNEVFTNEEGAYAIAAGYGDQLLVNYYGVKQKTVEVSNKKNIDIELQFEIEFLDEVDVKGSKAQTEKKNNYARKENRGLGYATSIVNAEDIRPADLYFVDVLRRIPQINVSGPSVNPRIWIRDRTIPPLFMVDNVPSLNYLAIPPQNIHSIEVLRSLAATNRFGADGAGGVVMITTKTAVQNEIYKLQSKNWALRTDNDYDNGKLYPETNNKTSEYIDELYDASSLNEAMGIYKRQKASLEQPSISFYFDAAEYFERWDSKIAFAILTSIADLAFDNAKALKTLAYKLEVLNKYEEAKFIYQRILELNPKHAQAYRDLAWVYQKTGAYNKAMLLYKQMLLGTIEGVDFSGLNDIVVNELRHLVLLHKSEIDYKDLPADILNANFKQDRRLVFEWNDPFAEFEIQFVNPNNKFFTWELSAFSQKERLLDGVKKGYQIEEFFIDDAETGKWTINIKNLKKGEALNPSYLKYTVYKNFGQPNESKTVRVIKLFEQQEKATLDEFMYK